MCVIFTNKIVVDAEYRLFKARVVDDHDEGAPVEDLDEDEDEGDEDSVGYLLQEGNVILAQIDNADHMVPGKHFLGKNYSFDLTFYLSL